MAMTTCQRQVAVREIARPGQGRQCRQQHGSEDDHDGDASASQAAEEHRAPGRKKKRMAVVLELTGEAGKSDDEGSLEQGTLGGGVGHRSGDRLGIVLGSLETSNPQYSE
ncbi:hypothetical protein E2562_038304 [Oryza meyeriana var. granulata]|uniref:Uncharacterized protein n=1 Tax=Oryza meyeriana var. granulata TaxID=110450 RepID=A0A6G1CM96_9ORYZ|nr:hypothetical protein E2562_038304 [Oryza meyeriana var. granulata]